MKPSLRVFELALLLLVLVVRSTNSSAQETSATASPSDRIARIVALYSSRGIDRAWDGCREIERMDDEVAVLDWSLLALDEADPVVVLMARKTRIALGEVDDVDRALIRIASDSALDTPTREAAVTLMSGFGEKRVAEALGEILDGEDRFDPRLRIAAARALAESQNDYRRSRDALVPLLDVDDPDARIEAALVLAEIGAMDGKIRRILRSLEDEPTSLGARASLVLSLDRALRKLERSDRSTSDVPSSADAATITRLELELDRTEGRLRTTLSKLDALQKSLGKTATHPLIGDLLGLIETHYVDQGKIDRDALIVDAAKGMVSTLDPFSSFMDPADTRRFAESISGEYAGIGAHVQKESIAAPIRIVKPVYGGPAYAAGLRSDDRILRIAGESASGKTLEELIEILKGAPGTEVEIRVSRRGWREPKTFSIAREQIRIDSVRSMLLPGGLGYIRLDQFGQTAVTEIFGALDGLQKQGFRGLVLDLRSNPGGYLEAAVAIVDSFVGEDPRPIVSQRDVSGRTSPEEHFPTPTSRGDFPLCVLVDDSSASASEIVSGALQDYGRAKVIGERTFGKGSVQRLFSLPESTNDRLGGPSRLRLTVQYYYLPSGRSIHTRRDLDGTVIEEGGVVPDIEVMPEEIALWRVEAIELLREKSAFEQYVSKHFKSDRETLEELVLEGDGEALDRYPGAVEHFGTFKDELRADPNDVRRALRAKIRRRLEDGRGAEFACDFREDPVLQRAILELLASLGDDPKSFEPYRAFTP